MGLKIVHLSDLHGQIPQETLPSADVYVLTGDILPNFGTSIYVTPEGVRVRHQWNVHLVTGQQETTVADRVSYVGREIDPEVEKHWQQRWAGMNSIRCVFGDSNAPVVVVRGNHDFIDLSSFVGGIVYEIGEVATEFDLLGYRFGGVRGVNSFSSEWSDQLLPEEFEERARALSDEVDILVTHSPPLGVLDQHGHSLGSTALMSYINRRNITSNPLRAHLFGHIHQSRGTVKLGDTLFSNASQGWTLLEIE